MPGNVTHYGHVSLKPFDPLDYHVDAIACDIAAKHPNVLATQAAVKKQVQSALSGLRDGGRQNRSSADKEPPPAVRVNDNPTGAFLGARKKGRKG